VALDGELFIIASLGGAIGGIVGVVFKDLVGPWILDRLRANRDHAFELERENRANRREDHPLRTRIIERVRSLMRGFHRYYATGEFSLAEWEALHKEIRDLVYTNDGARALGAQHYDAMMEAIGFDDIGIDRRGKIERTDPAQTKFSAMERENADHERSALTTLSISESGSKFIAVLSALGEDAEIEFGEEMRGAVEFANQILDALYPEPVE
jgi:hypothetical protein